MSTLVEILVPIGICVVLPIGVIWIIFASIMNRDNKNAEIILKAIENNSSIEVDALLKSFAKKEKTGAHLLNLRLLRGSIFSLTGVATGAFAAVMATNRPDSNLQFPFLLICLLSFAIGISYLIVYFMTRKDHKEGK